jgi:sn-glycerol 3-phosphate transport system ATP-binding protein
MSWLEIDNVRKTFSGGTIALDGVSFAIAKGEFFCVVGPTNAGKSTLLKIIAGLYRPDRGVIRLAGRGVTSLEPRERNVSLLFQNIALFPTLTGFDNIAFPLRTAGKSEAETRTRVNALADRLKIGHVLGRYPRTFSGGEQQRVAIARALAAPADVLLLDEPLTNLDARIRIALRIDFKALHRDSGQTILYVTHDQVEAFSLSDRIAVLNAGKLQQIGTPEEIYRRPVNRFVASFMGTPPMNIVAAELSSDGDRLAACGAGFTVPLDQVRLGNPSVLPKSIAIGVRPEAVRVSPSPSATTPFPTEVRWIERLGAKHILDIAVGNDIVKAIVASDHPIRAEGPAYFGFEPGCEHLLDPATDRFLRGSSC